MPKIKKFLPGKGGSHEYWTVGHMLSLGWNEHSGLNLFGGHLYGGSDACACKRTNGRHYRIVRVA